MEVTSEFGEVLTAMDAGTHSDELRSIPEGNLRGFKNSTGGNDGEKVVNGIEGQQEEPRKEADDESMRRKEILGAIVTPAKGTIGKIGETNRQSTIDGFLVSKLGNKKNQQQSIKSGKNNVSKNTGKTNKHQGKSSARKGGGEKLRNKYMVLADSSSEEEEAQEKRFTQEEEYGGEEGFINSDQGNMDQESEGIEDGEKKEESDRKKVKRSWAQEMSSDEDTQTEEMENEGDNEEDCVDIEFQMEEEVSGKPSTEYSTSDMVQTCKYDFRINTEEATYIFRPTRYFMQILQKMLEGTLAVEEAVALAEFRMGILRIEGQESATPQMGWGGYAALLQARWMIDKRDKEDVSICADIRNTKFREELSNHLIKIEDGNDQILEAIDRLSAGNEELEEEFGFNVETKLKRKKAGEISWYKKEEDILWLTKSTVGHVLPRVTVSEGEKLLSTAKIGIVGRKQFIVAGPCKHEGLTESMRDYLQKKVDELKGEKIGKSRKERAATLRRQIELRSEEVEKEATRMLIYNIPNQMKKAKDKWQADMTAALETVPHIKVSQMKLWTAMQTYFDTIDIDCTFGIITKCAAITVGTGFTSTHFAMLGENRPFLEGERPKHFEFKVRTRYLVHMLTEEEAKALPSALVQCFFRGCCEEYEINNFLRIVISRYLRDRQLQRLTMVQMKRHRVAATQYLNETVIVVYVLGKDAERQMSEGNAQLGLTGSIFMKQVEYCYLKFELVAAHVGIHGYVPDYVYDDKHVIVLVGIHTSLKYKEIINLLEKIVDLNKVIYWIFREVYLSRPRSLVIGINSESLPRIPDDENLRKLLDVNKKWRSDSNHLLFREFRDLRKVMKDTNSGVTTNASSTDQPKFNLPKSYASAVVTTNSSELTASTSQEVIATFRQQLVLYDQRIQQQEQRIIQSERRNEQLAVQLNEVMKTNDDMKHQLSEITRDNAETKQQIQTISTHIIGQDQRMVQLLMEAMGGREPARRENNNE